VEKARNDWLGKQTSEPVTLSKEEVRLWGEPGSWNHSLDLTRGSRGGGGTAAPNT
jgi:hypothetical protein